MVQILRTCKFRTLLILTLVSRINLRSLYQLMNLGILALLFGPVQLANLLGVSLMGLFIRLLVMTLILVCGVHP
jgi:hypothetical protein